MSALASAWRWLTEPAAGIPAGEPRRRARMLAGLLVVLVPLGALAVLVVPYATGPGEAPRSGPGSLLGAAAVASLVPAYALARSRWATVGAALAILVAVVFA
ncbi:MAG: hypothetical protein ACT4PT_07915, partial [Methanobacteriota archaeon]